MISITKFILKYYLLHFLYDNQGFIANVLKLKAIIDLQTY